MKQEGARGVIELRRAPRGSGARKLSIVVPKSIAPRAVDRNLLRRRIRAVLSAAIKDSGTSYNVIVRQKAALSLPFQDLCSELQRQLQNKL